MLKSVAIPAILLFTAAASAWGQGICGENPPDAFVVSGRIIAPGVTWDSYYEVLILNETQLLGYGYTDSTGMYSLPAQPAGLYTIVARIDGFKEYRERVNVWACERTYPYTIFLEPEEVEVPPVLLDFTGEVNEVVDVAELRRKFPRSVVEEFEKAQNDRLRGDAERARERLEKLLKEAPDFYDAHNALGSVYLEARRFRDAETHYNEARALNPGSAAPLVSLGSLYLQEADAAENPVPGIAGVLVPEGDLGLILDDARSVLEEAIALKPDASFAYYLLGIAHTWVGEYPKAEQNHKRALSLEARLRWARIGLANVYMKQHRWKEALDEFDAYIAEFPSVSNKDEVRATRMEVAAQLEGGSR